MCDPADLGQPVGHWKSLAVSLLLSTFLAIVATAEAGISTTVPLSSSSATNIARSFFPVSLQAGSGNVFLTSPVVVFVDAQRVGLQVHFQAYENNPDRGIAISEEGQALVSGELGFDASSAQVLLFKPRLDDVAFQNNTELTRRLRADIQALWSEQISDPIRADLPPHPLILPFRESIRNVTFDSRNILIRVEYD